MTDLATLAELVDAPGELAGYGSVVADVARHIATQLDQWEYIATDPDTGNIVTTGTIRRRPTGEQRRYVTGRNPPAFFPLSHACSRS